MEMRAGEVTCVMGRNGVGKTTLMKNIVGVLRSRRGKNSACRGGHHEVAAAQRVKSGIALVPQGRQIFPKLTVTKICRWAARRGSDGKRTIPEELFELFPILKSMGKRMGGDLIRRAAAAACDCPGARG